MKRLQRPLDTQAVNDADDQFYTNHPELVVDGERKPLDPSDPKQTALRKEWTDLYVDSGGAVDKAAGGKKPGDATLPCQKSWIKFRVLRDETERPISGVTLKITLPDGTEAGYATDANGMIEINNIQPGACDVTSDIKGARLPTTYDFVSTGGSPRGKPETASGTCIAEIEPHKVKTGETLQSLAAANALTWQELAEFNWGTSVAAEVTEYLRGDVGCKLRGGWCAFDSADDPGIVHVPKPWLKSGLATEQTHTIRLKTVPGLSVWIRLDVTPEEAADVGDRFVLTSTDGSYSKEKTVKDDQVPGDAYIDLRYTGLSREKSYTLKVKTSAGASLTLFENAPYDDLAGLSSTAGTESEEEEDSSVSEPAPDESTGEHSESEAQGS